MPLMSEVSSRALCWCGSLQSASPCRRPVLIIHTTEIQGIESHAFHSNRVTNVVPFLSIRDSCLCTRVFSRKRLASVPRSNRQCDLRRQARATEMERNRARRLETSDPWQRLVVARLVARKPVPNHGNRTHSG